MKLIPNTIVFSSREDAERVLKAMVEIIKHYTVVSMTDFNDLVGLPPTKKDDKVGWVNLTDIQIRESHEGYFINLPQPEPIML